MWLLPWKFRLLGVKRCLIALSAASLNPVGIISIVLIADYALMSLMFYYIFEPFMQIKPRTFLFSSEKDTWDQRSE